MSQPRDVFVVLDTMGAGRIVGVFESESDAMAVVGQFSNYYKVYRRALNTIDAEVLDWAQDNAQRAHLQKLIGQK